LIVIDASALLELLLLTPTGLDVAARVFGTEAPLHAPELVDLEVAQVLRRYRRDGELSTERASQALEDLADLHLDRHSHLPLLARVWELRDNMTAYDAAYVALAELLEAPLLTCDARLSRAPHGAKVEVVGRGTRRRLPFERS
jgi:predicted nucleic acid-binding protein